MYYANEEKHNHFFLKANSVEVFLSNGFSV